MRCDACDGKGYIETVSVRDAGEKSLIAQCRRCGNIEGYTRKVQENMGIRRPEAAAAEHETNVVSLFGRNRLGSL